MPPTIKGTEILKDHTLNLKQQKETPKELEAEEARLRVANVIKEARIMADCEKLKDAQDKLVEAQNELLKQQSNPLLRNELQELLELFKTPETYQQYGRPYVLSMESSQDRQRFAARGADMKVPRRPFATTRMDMYLEQASKFLRDPTMRVQAADEDFTADLANMDHSQYSNVMLVSYISSVGAGSVDQVSLNQKEYRNLANLQHENIVRLIGYCHETFGEFIDYKGEKILAQTIKRALCFEYMQNGSLDSYISELAIAAAADRRRPNPVRGHPRRPNVARRRPRRLDVARRRPRRRISPSQLHPSPHLTVPTSPVPTSPVPTSPDDADVKGPTSDAALAARTPSDTALAVATSSVATSNRRRCTAGT
uniref:VWA-Hint protein Vwaint domain-containing protein n=1 Tax=Triticum aestivum TaxID=4565 RepID=A0A077RSN2_WHEAT|nr:unnamed protein product [Triticum aestivum]